ncbi:hypothetical protein PDE_04562 [Penicillium oxalicum 114-2]|uniref:Uncharacterized protein n=1 Tax=Penicillium oxalicum (strain 114-2 / CGMCC 5302) TaxID=933388 RepID=S8B4V4_PENO1|nr:hypothetical protein PDE_04562 [Penicillium oxalicum 114-2]
MPDLQRNLQILTYKKPGDDKSPTRSWHVRSNNAGVSRLGPIGGGLYRGRAFTDYNAGPFKNVSEYEG